MKLPRIFGDHEGTWSWLVVFLLIWFLFDGEPSVAEQLKAWTLHQLEVKP